MTRLSEEQLAGIRNDDSQVPFWFFDDRPINAHGMAKLYRQRRALLAECDELALYETACGHLADMADEYLHYLGSTQNAAVRVDAENERLEKELDAAEQTCRDYQLAATEEAAEADRLRSQIAELREQDAAEELAYADLVIANEEVKAEAAALRQRVAKLERAVEPFVRYCEMVLADDEWKVYPDARWFTRSHNVGYTMGDIRTLAACRPQPAPAAEQPLLEAAARHCQSPTLEPRLPTEAETEAFIDWEASLNDDGTPIAAAPASPAEFRCPKCGGTKHMVIAGKKTVVQCKSYFREGQGWRVCDWIGTWPAKAEPAEFRCPKCGGASFKSEETTQNVLCMTRNSQGQLCDWFGTWPEVRAAREAAQAEPADRVGEGNEMVGERLFLALRTRKGGSRYPVAHYDDPEFAFRDTEFRNPDCELVEVRPSSEVKVLKQQLVAARAELAAHAKRVKRLESLADSLRPRTLESRSWDAIDKQLAALDQAGGEG